MKILQISGAAQSGGAERMAYSLYEGFARRGLTSWMAVARRNIDDAGIFLIPDPSSKLWSKTISILSSKLDPYRGRVQGIGQIQKVLNESKRFSYLLDWWRGRENFDYPGTAKILNITPACPDIIHCHNLHGRYFDLRELNRLSRRVPILLTLHDEWTFTGHCAYTLGCERWREGCGSCPDLKIYPPIRKDATAQNLALKKSIYAKSRLYICTPSQWLMDRVHQSVLAKGIAGSYVINNGVDQTLFKKIDLLEARRTLGLPSDSIVLLFTANAARRNVFKDHKTVFAAVRRVVDHFPKMKLLLLALGDTGPTETIGQSQLVFVPYEKDPIKVAAYYQASDLYLHAAKADNFPTTILEALSVGLPVVATAVGGISEQVLSLKNIPGCWSGMGYSPQVATGALVPAGDEKGMSEATSYLLSNNNIRLQLSENALKNAKERFNIDQQIEKTKHIYEEIIESWCKSTNE